MLMQVRLRLADRPGSLGRVTWLLGALGVDICQVVVLGRESGRAVDDFTVELPGSVTRDRLIASLEEVPGVAVEGVWPASVVPGGSTDVAVLGQVAALPDRGLATLVDAAPRLFGADWAALVTDVGSVGYASLGAPSEITVIEPIRPRAYQSERGGYVVMAPLGQRPPETASLVLGRLGPPGFHAAELDRLIQLVDAVATVLAGRAVDTESAPA